MPSPGSYGQEPSQLVNRQKRRGVALSCAECRRLKLKSVSISYPTKALESTDLATLAWMYTPISEKDFYETVFQNVYPADDGYQDPLSGHSLSVFFMVLALGTLLDLDLPAHSSEAMQYYQVARAAISLDSVLEEQTIPGIQALVLMCHFMFLSDMGGPRWVVMGIVVKMAQSIGLHRDSGKWKLDPEETQKRRELFYEILTYDSWQSLTFGRPPSLATAHIDSKLPHETTTTPTGEVEMSFAAWKHKFSAECLSVVHDQVFGTRRPTYDTIQELDKKVREWYVPPSLMVPGFGNAKIGTEVEQPSIELTMQRYVGFAIKEITLFYMHRGYFAQALEDNSTDPMGSKYASSVFAAHRSAMTFVALIESLYKQQPQLTERMWFLFTHVFSCAIVLGSIAVKSRMPLARGALDYLDLAHHLFSQVTDTARTGKILPILQKLKERAHAAHAALANSSQTPGESSSRSSFFGAPSIKTEDDNESTSELSALGGMTRLVARRGTPSSPSYSASNPSSPNLNPSTSPSRLNTHTPSAGPPSSASSSSYGPSMNDTASAWHNNYTQVQGMNLNLTVPEYSSYSGSSMSTPMTHGSQQAQAPEMGYGFPAQPLPQTSPHQHQQQMQHLQPHQHHQQAQQLAPMDTNMGDYYGYNNYNMHMVPTQEPSAPLNDMDYSWHNLVAQYNRP
ncbi:hypothetical protein D9611_006191 [Ephemerocybe angulata]|uniref:Xylanolytic transcriptional activator regulatory domain-containing protein n=1 Tax=Ephemerocybe angulata TaxID=980116 RepID=A0A8H5C7I5_9AGAR|nr:hypothetical protein D9611_006191 [Tulosesus angulatus]